MRLKNYDEWEERVLHMDSQTNPGPVIEFVDDMLAVLIAEIDRLNLIVGKNIIDREDLREPKPEYVRLRKEYDEQNPTR